MKTSYKISLVVLAALALTVSGQAVQLLQNTGFESWVSNGPGGPPDNWRITNADSSSATQATSPVHGGSYSVNFTWISPTQAICELLSDPVAVIGDSVYSCSLYYYDNDIAGRATIFFRWSTGTTNYYGSYTSDSPNWTRWGWYATAPTAATSVQVGLRFYDIAANWDGNATIYIDDFELFGPSAGAGNQPPTISQVFRYPYPNVYVESNTTVRATIVDDHVIAKDSLYIQTTPLTFTPVYHDSIVGDYYWYTIGPKPAGTLVEYYVVAIDDSSARSQSGTYSYTVQDSSAPSTPITTIQFNNTTPGTGDTCYPSPYQGNTLNVIGVVSGIPQGTRRDFYIQDCDSALWRGIFVYQNSYTASIGQKVRVRGVVNEYYGMTEIGNVQSVSLISSGNPICTTQVTSDQVRSACNPTSESFEGMLVKLLNAVCVVAPDSFGVAWVKTPGAVDSCAVDDDDYRLGGSQPAPLVLGQEYTLIVGHVSYSHGSYSVNPRFASDVIPASDSCAPADSIYNIEFTFNQGSDSSCFISPEEGNLVNICGIVTAVAQDTSFPYIHGFYVQDDYNPGGGATWTGIYVYDFTAGTDTVHPAIGDKIELTGKVKEYYGWTEIDSLVSYRILASGQPLPETTDVRIIDLINGCNFGAEAFENILVKIDSVTVLSGSPITGKWWIKDNSTTDSIPMDNDLWVYGADQPNPAPSQGARYLSVVGVIKWEGRSGYDNEYMLLPRKASDYVPLVIPQANLVSAWSIDNTHVMALFDRAMQEASAEIPSNYQLRSGITVSAAELDLTTRRRVLLTTGTQGNGIGDTLITQGVIDSTGIPMINPDSVRFWQGFTPISMIQTPNSFDSTAPSPMVNEVVTVKGVFIADTSSYYPNNFYIRDNSGDYFNGILIYMPAPQSWLGSYWPAIGDTTVVTAQVREYFGETELDYLGTYRNVYLVGQGGSPAPSYQTTNAGDFRYNAPALNNERFEGSLVKLCDSLLVGVPGVPDAYSHYLFSLTTGDTISIEGEAAHRSYTVPPTGSTVAGITGVVRWRRNAWRLVPRSDADLNTGYDCGGGAPCEYLPGDINGDGNRIGGDVTFGVRYFKGIGGPPPDSCYMDSTGGYLYVAGDVNGNCEFRGSDITRLVAYFKGNATLSYCHFFPPPIIRPSPFREIESSK